MQPIMQDDPKNVSNAPETSSEELLRIFNSAIISTRAEQIRDFSSELYQAVESPAFRAILNSIRQMARLHGMSEREAAEAVIRIFRKIDRLWGDYVFQEGMDRLRGPGSKP